MYWISKRSVWVLSVGLSRRYASAQLAQLEEVHPQRGRDGPSPGIRRRPSRAMAAPTSVALRCEEESEYRS